MTSPDYASFEYLCITRRHRRASHEHRSGIVGAFKQLGGGNIKEYVDVAESGAAGRPTSIMLQQRTKIGAHAVIGMRLRRDRVRAGSDRGPRLTAPRSGSER